MNSVRSGVSLPFEVTYDPGLSFVAMKVFDGVTLVATIPMTNTYGSTYVGSFTPLENKSYLIHKAVYTDGTYTAFNNNYAHGSETIDTGLSWAIWNIASSIYNAPGTMGALLGSSGSPASTIGVKVLTGQIIQPNILRGVIIQPNILRGRIFT